MTNSHDHFTALCSTLRKEGGAHSGKTNVVAIAVDGDMSVTLESLAAGNVCLDIAWRNILRVAVRRYLNAWEGDDYDRERALSSLKDDIAEIVTEYRMENGMEGKA